MSREILTLRAMAWERAKGELKAYMQTFWPKYNIHNEKIENGFELADKNIRDFIEDFEDNCR